MSKICSMKCWYIHVFPKIYACKKYISEIFTEIMHCSEISACHIYHGEYISMGIYTHSSTDISLAPIVSFDWLKLCCGNLILNQKKK